MNPNSDRRKPSSTRRALASLEVHPCRFAMRLRRFPLSAGRRMLMTIERVDFMAISTCNFCKHCNILVQETTDEPFLKVPISAGPHHLPEPRLQGPACPPQFAIVGLAVLGLSFQQSPVNAFTSGYPRL